MKPPRLSSIIGERLTFGYTQLLQATQEGARYCAVLHHTDAELIARVRQICPVGASDAVTVATPVSPTNNRAVAAISRTRAMWSR